MKRWSFYKYSGVTWYTPLIGVHYCKHEQFDLTFAAGSWWCTLTYWIEPILNPRNHNG